ncbi:putative RNA recognition motif domain, nucleotide-binding alpha-beta plait domain superfamily [Helianthus annuus]|nr:putative RNA recognition motif domain, nucleotide-binding alpha-beta plait domain superfamily [Helianthus annuus]
MSGGITKFFVTNLPEGCTPWELRSCLERFGEITGTYVAKKRDKLGNRFGFVSFKGVKDRQDMVKSLGGVKMGEYKLKVNVAKFAVENTGVSIEQEVRGSIAKAQGQAGSGIPSSFRDARKFSDVVGSSKEGGGAFNVRDHWKEDGSKFLEKSVVVPDRTGAFGYLSGLALVGRTVDLETLVDFDRLLRISKTIVANIQYLGGLSLLVTFHDEASVRGFLDRREVWEPWFTKLDPWCGQTLPLERVAWLKLNGIPLHLFDADVMGLVGGLFGKVLHVPKYFEEDQDLSYSCVGVLVGTADPISEGVSLRWKNRSFRIWVEEDSKPWVPDCLGSANEKKSEDGTSDVSPPVVSSPGLVDRTVGGSQSAGLEGGAMEPQRVNAVFPHAVPTPMHVERETGGGNDVRGGDEEALLSVRNVPGSKEVGPEVVTSFKSGSGEKCGRPKRRSAVGLKSRKAHLPSKGISVGAQPVLRPNKRSRNSFEDADPGFGFVGFADNPKMDLNTSARSPESAVEADQTSGDGVPDSANAGRNHGGDSEGELEATINVGAQVGVDFGIKTDQISRLFGITGINEVDP